MGTCDARFRRSQERFDENKDGVEDEPVDWKIQEPQILGSDDILEIEQLKKKSPDGAENKPLNESG